MVLRVLITLGLAGVSLGCGDSATIEPPGGTAGSGSAPVERVCEDADGDGFGNNCKAGKDCDDDDPDNTDLCYRCKNVDEGCPCEKGTKPEFCDPPDMHVEGGTLVCDEGTRYCKDGMWGECEVIGEYRLVPDE